MGLLMASLTMAPLALAAVFVIFHHSGFQKVSSLILAGSQVLVAYCIFVSSSSSEPITYFVGGWASPLGISFAVDFFSASFIFMTSLVFFFSTLYSCAYMKTEDEVAARFWVLWWLLNAGLNTLFLSADLFNIYVALEVIGLSSVGLVALKRDRDAMIAALRYLFVSMVGSLLYLLGVALLYREYGTLDIAALMKVANASSLTTIVLVLFTAGLLLKTALAPLHFWLPPAHSSAMAPVSALLSALVVKASFFLIVKFWLEVLPVAVSSAGLTLLGILGACAVLTGSWKAFRATRLKLLVAYSTVAQLGYLFLVFPLVSSSSTFSLTSTISILIVFLVLAHALSKAALFLAAGYIQKSLNHDTINELKGVSRVLPITVFAIAVAGISLIGLPPSGGFVAKWMLLSAAVIANKWWIIAVVIAGGLMTAAYIFRVLNIAFYDEANSDKETAKSEARVMPLTALGLSLLAMLLGFSANWIARFSV